MNDTFSLRSVSPLQFAGLIHSVCVILAPNNTLRSRIKGHILNMSTNLRNIEYLVEGIETSDGAGVNLTRIIGSPELNMLDPFFSWMSLVVITQTTISQDFLRIPIAGLRP